MKNSRLFKSDKVLEVTASKIQIARPCQGKADFARSSRRLSLPIRWTCPHCKVIGKPGSEGPYYKCKVCGRRSNKIMRRDTVPIENRPICPECGSPNPYSTGKVKGIREYVCKFCGRNYTTTTAEIKNKESEEISNLEVQIE